MNNDQFLQTLKSASNIVEIVGEHVVLRKVGSNYQGLCPFHSERTPSFSVSELRQLYHCYGCKAGGDLISFVMEILGISFREAVEELADRAKIPLPPGWKRMGHQGRESEDPAVQEKKEKSSLAFKLNRFAAAFFHQNLGNSILSKEYFQNRGVPPVLWRQFYLGASLPEWHNLSQHLTEKKAPIDLAIEVGLVKPSTRGNERQFKYFDLFRNRLMFPILDMRGKVAGFGGRALDEQTPKYLNSPESLIFHKGKLLFGLYQAQKFIREKDEVILVEGYFDVLAMHAAGFANTVATCGTALSIDHIQQLKRFASKIIVLFDGDRAGIEATERAMEVGLDQGIVLFGAQMPPNLDPDELLLGTQGKEKMGNLIKNATSLIDSRISQAVASSLKSPEDQVKAIKRVTGWMSRFQDPIGREVRLEDFQKRLGVSRNLIQGAKDGKRPHLGPVPAKKKGVEPKPRSLQISAIDRTLLLGLGYGRELGPIFDELEELLPPGKTWAYLLEYPPGQELVQKILETSGTLQQFWKAPEGILTSILDPQLRSILTEAWVSSESPVSDTDLRVAVYRALTKVWTRFSQEIKLAIIESEAKKDAELQQKLMKDYLDVQRKMKEFNNFYDKA